MAIAVSHTFTTAIADDAAAQAAGEVLPSHWNAAHTLSGFGTGVATALAVNVGSAGAPVLFNGALGTPSSGTLTNCTGLPAAGVVGTAAILGANTFTATQTINPAANTQGLIVSGYSLTSTNTQGAVEISGTLNGTGITNFVKVAATVTSANAASKILGVYGGSGGTTELVSVTSNGSVGGVLAIGGGAALAYFSSELRLYSDYTVGSLSGVFRAGGLYSGSTNVGIVAGSIKPANQTGVLHGTASAIQALNNTSGSETDFWPVEVKSLGIRLPSNGQRLDILSLTELTTIAAAASTDTTIQMPAGAIILAVSTRVTVVIPTATSFSVGDAGSATRFGTSATISTAANTTDAGTLAGAYYNASAASVRLTMNGGSPAANTGRVRVTIFYFLSTPPTS